MNLRVWVIRLFQLNYFNNNFDINIFLKFEFMLFLKQNLHNYKDKVKLFDLNIIIILFKDKTLKIATKLYPADDVKLNNNYVSDAKQYFLSGVETLDFKNSITAANTINKYVEEATNDKIHDIVSPGKQVHIINIWSS